MLPASALMATTSPAASALTRIVWRRCAGVKCCVKWRKKGNTPTGLTIANSATRGLRRSMAGCYGSGRAPLSQRGAGLPGDSKTTVGA